MDLSDTAILILGTAVLIAVVAALCYIVTGSRRNKARQHEETYNWQPEQDYDVEWSDEGPMSPPWPTLKRRERSTPPERP